MEISQLVGGKVACQYCRSTKKVQKHLNSECINALHARVNNAFLVKRKKSSAFIPLS